MPDYRPIIGVTMGDPVGIGPEIILLSLCISSLYEVCRPLVIGDIRILDAARNCTQSRLLLESVKDPEAGKFECGSVDVLNLTELNPNKISWGNPTVQTGKAMMRYIIAAVDLASKGSIAAITTCPINKTAMRIAGFSYSGHTSRHDSS